MAKLIRYNKHLFDVASFEHMELARNLNKNHLTNALAFSRWVYYDWYYVHTYNDNTVRIKHEFISAN